MTLLLIAQNVSASLDSKIISCVFVAVEKGCVRQRLSSLVREARVQSRIDHQPPDKEGSGTTSTFIPQVLLLLLP
jgi:hypothetical protein